MHGPIDALLILSSSRELGQYQLQILHQPSHRVRLSLHPYSVRGHPHRSHMATPRNCGLSQSGYGIHWYHSIRW